MSERHIRLLAVMAERIAEYDRDIAELESIIKDKDEQLVELQAEHDRQKNIVAIMSRRIAELVAENKTLRREPKLDSDVLAYIAELEAELAIYKEVSQFSHDKWFAFHNPKAAAALEVDDD